MQKILLISPHFDDAVLSAGQHMADRPDAEVVTVFAGVPLTPDNVKTPYDIKCGFPNAREAVGARTQENDQALALLQAKPLNLDFPDSQYGNDINFERIVEKLQAIVNGHNYEYIMAPLGIGHPDHVMTTEAVMKLQTTCPVYFWEDLPLRVVEPELVFERLHALGFTLDRLWQNSTTYKNIANKIRALACYSSQMGTGILDPYLMYVPERFWKYRT